MKYLVLAGVMLISACNNENNSYVTFVEPGEDISYCVASGGEYRTYWRENPIEGWGERVTVCTCPMGSQLTEITPEVEMCVVE